MQNALQLHADTVPLVIVQRMQRIVLRMLHTLVVGCKLAYQHQ
jgi:hypothetical protein